MTELRDMARAEGRAWASRLHKQLQSWNRPANDDFPGRIEEAVMLAERLNSDPQTQHFLARIIHAEAQAAWWTLGTGST